MDSLLMEIEIADPEKYDKFINKLVKVVTFKKTIHIGYFYSIDPVSKSVIIMTYNSLKLNKIVIIPGTSIDKIEILDDIVNEDIVSKHNYLFSKTNECDSKMIKENLARTIEKLTINRIEYVYDEEENVIKVGNALKIESPFTMEFCFSDNSIVLDKIKSILN